jgi:hypothetical protein
MRDQLSRLSEHRDAALTELLDMKSRFRYTSEELERTQILIQTRGEEEDHSRRRINAMMLQVENMLTQVRLLLSACHAHATQPLTLCIFTGSLGEHCGSYCSPAEDEANETEDVHGTSERATHDRAAAGRGIDFEVHRVLC